MNEPQPAKSRKPKKDRRGRQAETLAPERHGISDYRGLPLASFPWRSSNLQIALPFRAVSGPETVAEGNMSDLTVVLFFVLLVWLGYGSTFR
jgi:hypothetical protein